MSTSVITLTTDFGSAAPYVAVMKGVILSINPAARILDLSHSIRPQDLRHADYFLAIAVPYFPPGTIHVCVVDPEVGSDRRAIVAWAGGQVLIAPDNGVLTTTLRVLGNPVSVHELNERRFWREPVSDTFHGRDVFAPVAAHLSLGVRPDEIGPVVDDWVRLSIPEPRAILNGWMGAVQFIDDFGNVITNIPAERVLPRPDVVGVGGSNFRHLPLVRTYAEAKSGELVGQISSDGFFELAVVKGNAAERLRVTVGDSVTVGWAR